MADGSRAELGLIHHGVAEQGSCCRFPKDRHSRGEPSQVIAGEQEAFFTTDMEEGNRAGLC